MFKKIVAAAALAVALSGFAAGFGAAQERPGVQDVAVGDCVGVCGRPLP